MFGDPRFWNAVANTIVVVGLQLVFFFPAPLALALLLHSLVGTTVKRFVQSVVYLPHFLSWVIVVALFQHMLGGAGVVNGWLGDLGLDPIHLIGNPGAYKPLVVAQVIWKECGWATIIFLAALARIDSTLYEASAVDGAGRWRQLWHVTLPGLRGLIILLLILRLGDALSVGFEQIVLQQQAVGKDASEVLDTYVYNNGVVGGNWGVSAAVGLVKGLLGVVLVLTANRIAHIFGEEGVYQK